MILRNLTLTNFGTFRGRQEIPLTPQPDRPIVLVGGMNGAGKTTLFEAIRICLYGQSALGRVSKEAYTAHLADRIHTSPSLLIQPNFASLGLEFDYADPDARHTYLVTRSWERNGNGKVHEQLVVQRNGSPLTGLDVDHWQDFVRDLIPEGVLQFFFFDGEKIQHLAEDASDQEVLAESIKSLLGLDLAERLHADLSIYLSRLSRETRKRGKVEEADNCRTSIDGVVFEIEKLREQKASHEEGAEAVRAAISRLEVKIAGEGGAFAAGREKLIKEQSELKAKIEANEDALRVLCATVLPFALAGDLCAHLRRQLADEAAHERAEIAAEALSEAQRDLFDAVRGESFWQSLDLGTKKQLTLREHLLAKIEGIWPSAGPKEFEPIHRLSLEERARAQEWMGAAVGPVTDQARELGRKLEGDSRRLSAIQRKLTRIPSDDVLKPLLDELRELNKQLAERCREQQSVEDRLQVAERERAELERKLERINKEIGADAKHHKRMETIPRVQAVLQEYKTALIERKVKDLQDAVSECFGRIHRKKDALQEIRINALDFSVTLYDKKQRPIPKARLSAGEKQIFAISMLWALAKTSGRPLPIIIDTPLGRLDSAHRKLLVKHYFPSASHQVVILSTDTEVDKDYFEELRPEISHAHHLEFDSAEHATTVQQGYFWRAAHEAH